IAVPAVEAFEHRLCLRLGGECCGEVGRNLDARLAGIGGTPPTVGLCPLDLRRAGRMHPPFGQQSLGDAGVSLGPRAAPPARREALTVGGLVAATDLAVDPAVAERFLQRLVVREAGRFYRPLLGEDQPDAPWLCVVLAEPDAPGGRIADDQLRRLGGHSVTACQRLFRASAATDPPSRRTLRTNGDRGDHEERP